MWRSLFMLWSVPAVVGMLIALWEVKGTPAIGERASRLLTDASERAHPFYSIAWVLTTVPVAALFFVIGLLQGSVFVNLGIAGSVAAPMAVGATAMVLIPLWLRFVCRESGVRQRSARVLGRTERSATVRSR